MNTDRNDWIHDKCNKRNNAFLSHRSSGPLCWLFGRFGGWLGRGGHRSPARGSTRRPRCRFSLGRCSSGEMAAWLLARCSSGGRRRAPTATGRLRPGPRGSGGRCITPGQDVLDRLCLLLYCRELLGKALDGVAEQPSPPGRWGRRESVPCRHPSSLPGWARDGAPGPPWWTSPSRGTVLWLSLLVEQSQSPCAVPASTPGRYYPCASVWAPWHGEPAG